MLIEIATFSVEAAVIAQKSGADRIELCSSPLEGGLTPSSGCIQTVRKLLNIPLNVMIRPREGDFYYSSREFETMLTDIEILKNEGVDGIVTGVLHSNGSIDSTRMQLILKQAGSMEITFHRAFDMTRDPLNALDTLIGLGIKRILTSGCRASAMDGLEKIKELQQAAGNQIVIMPGGGINETNILEIIQSTGVSEVHMTAKKITEGRMEYRNPAVSMGSPNILTEYNLLMPDGNVISRIKKLFN
ncbi:MAG: copper homeostasis protein CutC [Bacteroidetes bacterium]|nr:copper homeostasis protein CutC [Bacteroidota bacterium]